MQLVSHLFGRCAVIVNMASLSAFRFISWNFTWCKCSN